MHTDIIYTTVESVVGTLSLRKEKTTWVEQQNGDLYQMGTDG